MARAGLSDQAQTQVARTRCGWCLCVFIRAAAGGGRATHTSPLADLTQFSPVLPLLLYALGSRCRPNPADARRFSTVASPGAYNAAIVAEGSSAPSRLR
jgi:hypothetical protein